LQLKKGDDYLEITYGSKPFTVYPKKLARHICETHGMRPSGLKLLDLGSGRGELAESFAELGFLVTALDQAHPLVNSLKFDFIQANLEKKLPFKDNTFDVIFNKSVLEHFYYPERLLIEAHRVLKPGGLIISLTPSWRHNIKMFYEDFTHRTPFTLESLIDIHKYAGFEGVSAKYFIQLPWLFTHPKLESFVSRMSLLIPSALKKQSKTMRFAKEVMVLASGSKGPVAQRVQ